MHVALISDIHSNIVALEAVMEAIKRHRPERIISLGDQVNLGPCPRETLALLKAEGVTCLHGNHERYILSVMAGDSAYDGANFDSLRFNAALLTPGEITFPKELRMGSVLMTHSMPGDDRFPIFDAHLAYPRLQQLRYDKPTHIICGHGHNPTHYALPHLTVNSIGAVGCMDDGVPGTVPYVIAEIDERGAALKPYYAQYDAKRLYPLFISGGMAEYCPIMSRIICTQMTHNVDILCGFVTRALEISDTKGEARVSQATWEEADRKYPWPDGMTTAEFWRQM